MKKIIKNYTLGFLWVIGLILAGGDGAVSPVVNFIGVFLVGFSSYLVIDKSANGRKVSSKRVGGLRRMKPQFN